MEAFINYVSIFSAFDSTVSNVNWQGIYVEAQVVNE
jgi:hypothetical protein